MVIKGKSRSNGGALAKYLLSDKNDKVEVIDVRHNDPNNDLYQVMREWDAIASAAPTEKHVYHASINAAPGEEITPEMLARTLELLDKEHGLGEQQRVVVMHENNGRRHYHVAWSRIDTNSPNLRAIPDSHNYRKHEIVARQIEREFGLQRVQGAHVEREGRARPERTPSRAEQQQGQRTGIKPKEAKELITELWRGSKTGVEFEIALESKDWRLARGDRRDFVLVDPTGSVHSLARRIAGAKTADVRERLSDIDPQWIPTVAEAKALAREGDRRPTWAENAVHAARENTRTGGEFLAEVGRGGITLARVTPEDVATLQAEHALAFTLGEAVPYVPPIIEGDLAAITPHGTISPLSALRLGSAAEYEQRLAADGFPLPSVLEARDSALEIHGERQQGREDWQQRREAAQIEWATPGQGREPTDGLGPDTNPGGIAQGGATRAAEAALDAVTGIFENIFAPEPPKPGKIKERAQEQARVPTNGQGPSAKNKAIEEERRRAQRQTGIFPKPYGIDINASLEDQERQLRQKRERERGGRSR